MESLEKTTFGRNNFGCPESNSDVEPPALFIRASIDLGYMTYKEFAYLLWKLEDVGHNYTDSINEVKLKRGNGSLELGEEANKYIDCKPIMILLRWGFLSELEENSNYGKKVIINPVVYQKFEKRLRNLKVYNIDMNVISEDDVDSNNEFDTSDLKEIVKRKFANKDFEYFESDPIYEEINNKYGIEVLKSTNGKELLYLLFGPKSATEDGLTYRLEFDKKLRPFGSISGGSAYKMTLHFNETNGWIYGTHQKNAKVIDEADAISLAEDIRDRLVSVIEFISNKNQFDNISDYEELDKILVDKLGSLYFHSWIQKYLAFIFPNVFTNFYARTENMEWCVNAFKKMGVEPSKNITLRHGQFVLYFKELNIPNFYVYRIILELFSKGDLSTVDTDISSEDYESGKIVSFEISGNGKNLVVYGTPGCGKSYYVEHELLKEYPLLPDKTHARVIRTTFYQDYTNTDFIGQILPYVKPNGDVTYKFNPGPFALALKEALSCDGQNVALVIEELNRGNAPAIFGDVFQLLDRDENGISKYAITDVNLLNWLNDELDSDLKNIKIPGNLFIYATMNTSDQNVFTLDTAFKRRWDFKKIKNEFKSDHAFAEKYVPGMELTWKDFVNKINLFMTNDQSIIGAEDKQIGVYFIDESGMRKDVVHVETPEQKEEFAYKIFEYLWDDVAKFDRKRWFKGVIKTLDELIEKYINEGITVFNEEVFGAELYKNGTVKKESESSETE